MSIFLGLTLVLGAPHSRAETGIRADGGKNLTPAFRECFGDTRRARAHVEDVVGDPGVEGGKHGLRRPEEGPGNRQAFWKMKGPQ